MLKSTLVKKLMAVFHASVPGDGGGGGGEGEGGRGTWVNLCWVCATGLSEPLPIIVYSVANYRRHLSNVLANVIFAIPT